MLAHQESGGWAADWVQLAEFGTVGHSDRAGVLVYFRAGGSGRRSHHRAGSGARGGWRHGGESVGADQGGRAPGVPHGHGAGGQRGRPLGGRWTHHLEVEVSSIGQRSSDLNTIKDIKNTVWSAVLKSPSEMARQRNTATANTLGFWRHGRLIQHKISPSDRAQC